MTEKLIKFGFTAGVLSEQLYSRSDIEKYDLGLAKGRNFVIDYLGGAFSRAGTEFLDFIQDDDEPTRLAPFVFNADIANTYAVVFSKNKIRFIQDGAYVLEAAKTIESATSTAITSTAHGFVSGDWVKAGSRTFEVVNETTNTFELTDTFGAAFDPTTLTATEIQRIYTIASPYATADLYSLRFDQDKDELYINSTLYTERKLIRNGNTNWQLIETGIVGYVAAVDNITATPSTSGGNGTLYAIAPVSLDGVEAPLELSSFVRLQNSVDITASLGKVRLEWDSVNNAAYYKIYRSLFVSNDEVSFAQELGLLGTAFGPLFVDKNFIIDFASGPMRPDNPFAPGAVLAVNMTNPGSGYNNSTTVSIADGTGFEGAPIIYDGAVIGVRILKTGTGYESDSVVTFSGAGTGAAATITITGETGLNPNASSVIQQRRVRAGTLSNPMTLFASRIGKPDNYDYSGFSRADDPIIVTMSEGQLTPIRFVKENLDGMFLFTDKNVSQVRGTDDNALTAENLKKVPQSQEGCADLEPILIDREYVYLQSSATSIQALRPSNLPTYYVNFDTSVFSSHFFKSDNPIISWTWAKGPHRLLWAVRMDGTFLSMTFVPEQQIYAWTNHTTAGSVKDVITVSENRVDRVYLVVERDIGGVRRQYIERFADREANTVEEMWAVDSGLRSNLAFPGATITADGFEGEAVTVTSDAGIFSLADEQKKIRIGEGRGVVVEYLSPTQIVIFLEVAIENSIPELEHPRYYRPGEWSLTDQFTTFTGLYHLEGEMVEILADGNEQEKRQVVNGAITLDYPASYVVAGLGFSADLKTLPATVSNAVIENRAKGVASVALRLYKTRGVEVGDGDGDFMYPLPSYTNENIGAPPQFKNGLFEVSIRAGYDFDGSIRVRKRGPVNVAALGLVLEVELEGD